MQDIIILIYDKEAINVELLHEELAAELGTYFAGIGTGSEVGKVNVYLKADTPVEMQSQVATIVQAHVATHLTSAQQEKAERITFVRSLRQKPRSEWTEEDKNLLLWFMAQQLDATALE
jgi:hypothetical protein